MAIPAEAVGLPDDEPCTANRLAVTVKHTSCYFDDLPLGSPLAALRDRQVAARLRHPSDRKVGAENLVGRTLPERACRRIVGIGARTVERRRGSQAGAVCHITALWTRVGAPSFFRPESGCLHDRPPSLGVRTYQSREFGGQAAGRIEGQFVQTSFDLSGIQRFTDRRAELAHDFGGRPCRKEDAEPVDNLECRISGLSHRRYTGELWASSRS